MKNFLKSSSVLYLINEVSSAGMTSHNIAALRASQFEYFGPETTLFQSNNFYGLAKDRYDAIQAGSPFPDYLYACGTEHDAGEEAHWTPFQIASVDYIRKNYPTWATDGRDSDGAGLVAFTFGVTSHYITDINWHGLEVIPSGEGLIRTMGYADFYCTDGDLCSVAHTAADTGGEFAGAASLDLSWYPAADWFMPTTDLVNIYAEMNATGQGPLVEPEWINACAVIFYAGSFGVSHFGDLIYPLLAPTLGGLLWDNYFDFPVGGIDDNAAWTSFMWNRLADWLVYGPPPPDPPPNSSRKLQNKNRKITLDAKKNWVQTAKKILLTHNITSEESLFTIYDTSSNDKIHTSSGKFIGLKRINYEDINHNKNDKFMLMKRDANILNQLAQSLIDSYLIPLFPDLLSLNSPTFVTEVRNKLTERANKIARTRYFPEEDDIIEHEKEDTLDLPVRTIAVGTTSHQYYGTSLSLSTNGNSIMVGSPGSGRIGGPQEGIAQLLLDPSLGQSSKSTVTFYGGRGSADTTAFPSYERFGWSSAPCDVNGDQIEDWIICAPSYAGGRDTEAAHGNYTGRCDIFYGPFKSDLLNPNGPIPDVSIYGDKIWGNFGLTLTTGDIDGDGLSDIIISAPYAGSYSNIAPNDRGDLSDQGAVYIYLASSFQKTFTSSNKLHLIASSSADIILQQPESFQWFGKSLAIYSNNVESPILIIGAPTYHSKQNGEENSPVGKIFFYQINKNKEVKLIRTLTGCGHTGRTGYSMAVSNTYFAFSEPYWNATTTSTSTTEFINERPRDKLVRSGRVLVINWSDLLSLDSTDLRVCELSNFLEARGNSFESRFGTTLQFVSDGNSLIISAPLANDGRGEVYSMDILTQETKLIFESPKRTSSNYKPRYGQSILTIGSNIYIGGPYSNVNDLEQVGVLSRI